MNYIKGKGDTFYKQNKVVAGYQFKNIRHVLGQNDTGLGLKFSSLVGLCLIICWVITT